MRWIQDMATISFESRRIADKLKSAGFSAEQAETVVRVIAEAQQDLVTVKDLDASLSSLKTDLAVLKSEVGQMK